MNGVPSTLVGALDCSDSNGHKAILGSALSNLPISPHSRA